VPTFPYSPLCLVTSHLRRGWSAARIHTRFRTYGFSVPWKHITIATLGDSLGLVAVVKQHVLFETLRHFRAEKARELRLRYEVEYFCLNDSQEQVLDKTKVRNLGTALAGICSRDRNLMDGHKQQIRKSWHAMWFIVSSCGNDSSSMEYQREELCPEVKLFREII